MQRNTTRRDTTQCHATQVSTSLLAVDTYPVFLFMLSGLAVVVLLNALVWAKDAKKLAVAPAPPDAGAGQEKEDATSAAGEEDEVSVRRKVSLGLVASS